MGLYLNANISMTIRGHPFSYSFHMRITPSLFRSPVLLSEHTLKCVKNFQFMVKTIIYNNLTKGHTLTIDNPLPPTYVLYTCENDGTNE